MHASPTYQFITRGQRLIRIKIIFLMASIFDNFLPAQLYLKENLSAEEILAIRGDDFVS